MIYLIRSPKLSIVKIGCTSSNYKKLYQRYNTYYGPTLIIHFWNNKEKNSKSDLPIHKDLESIKYHSELYSNIHTNTCIDYIRSIHGNESIYKNKMLYKPKITDKKFKCVCESEFDNKEAYDIHLNTYIHKSITYWKNEYKQQIIDNKIIIDRKDYLWIYQI